MSRHKNSSKRIFFQNLLQNTWVSAHTELSGALALPLRATEQVTAKTRREAQGPQGRASLLDSELGDTFLT